MGETATVKHVLTFAVTAWWLTMVALLVHRQMPSPAPDLASLPSAVTEPTGDEGVEEWFGLYREERKIGHARRVMRRTSSGHTFEDQSSFSFTMFGTPQQLTTHLIADTDEAFALRRFKFSVASAAATFGASGTSDGRRLAVRYGSGGRGSEAMIPLGGPIHVATALRPRIVAAKPAVGARYAHAVFNPLTFSTESVTTVVEGRESVDGREVLRIVEEHQGLRGRVWLDEDGRVLREEAMLGFVLRREPAPVARSGIDAAGGLDVSVDTRIPLEGRISDPRARATLVLRVSGAAAGRIPSDPPRQRVAGDVVHIVREAPPDLHSAAALSGPLVGYTAPTPFIESDDPAIVATAREIVGSEGDPAQNAARLTRWVNRNLTQVPTATVPSAREVLRSRRGDCNEHAVLLTALARAVGIPARVVAGAVYLEDGFYYHAWSELWVGRWLSADAVLDQIPTDATHVKLIEGGPERHLQLAEVIGRLSFATMEGDS